MRVKFVPIAAAFFVCATVAAFFAYRESDLRLDFRIASVLDGEEGRGLSDLAPVSEFLSSEWGKSPENFIRAFERFFLAAESRKTPLGKDSVLRVFERSHPNFCDALETAEPSETIATYCEWKKRPLPELPKIAGEWWDFPDCDAYSMVKNRQKCLNAVGAVFSRFSDSHCPDAACKDDQSAFRALSDGISAESACASRPSAVLKKGCEEFVSKVLAPMPKNAAEPPLDRELKSAISGEATDAVSAAIRRAAYSEESSPAEECASVPADQAFRCENMAKAALDFAERERSEARIRRIRDAVTENLVRTEK